MIKTIELENELDFEIEEQRLIDNKIILFDTDLHDDDLINALDDMLYFEKININGRQIVDLYLKSLIKDAVSLNDVFDYLINAEVITEDELNSTTGELLDYDLIQSALRGIGGFESLFELLGYKIIEVDGINVIAHKDVDHGIIDDFINGYHHYRVSVYDDDKLTEIFGNKYIPNLDELKSYVAKVFKVTGFQIVNNPLAQELLRNNPNDSEITLVTKDVDRYKFKDVNYKEFVDTREEKLLSQSFRDLLNSSTLTKNGLHDYSVRMEKALRVRPNILNNHQEHPRIIDLLNMTRDDVNSIKGVGAKSIDIMQQQFLLWCLSNKIKNYTEYPLIKTMSDELSKSIMDIINLDHMLTEKDILTSDRPLAELTMYGNLLDSDVFPEDETDERRDLVYKDLIHMTPDEVKAKYGVGDDVINHIQTKAHHYVTPAISMNPERLEIFNKSDSE